MKLAWIAAALLLAGCTNMVTSEKPLFTAADSKGAPVFREGVWASPEKDCEADLDKPLADWPSCANGDVMGPDGPVKAKQQAEMLLVAGDPVIIQLDLGGAMRKAMAALAAAAPAGATTDAKPPAGADELGVYYTALRPTKSDRKGRVTAFEAWQVECGPPPPKPPPAEPAKEAEPGKESQAADLKDLFGKVTEQPLPGLKIVGDHCLATEPGPVRAAAAASRAWQSELRETRWVRDGGR